MSNSKPRKYTRTPSNSSPSSTNTKSKSLSRSKSKSKTPHTFKLCHAGFRNEYRELLPAQREEMYYRQDHKWSYKEICFAHKVLPMLKKYNLCPNQVPSFDHNKEHYSPLTYGCTDTTCNKIGREYITKYNLRKRFCVDMKSLNIGFSTKNKNMESLWMEIYDAEKNKVLIKQRFKLMKVMAGNIKRFTQPLTQKDVVCSVAFGKTEIFMVIHEEQPRVVMSIGVRKDDWDRYGQVEMTQKLKAATDVAPFWYQSWGVQGIQEVFYIVFILYLHCF